MAFTSAGAAATSAKMDNVFRRASAAGETDDELFFIGSRARTKGPGGEKKMERPQARNESHYGVTFTRSKSNVINQQPAAIISCRGY